MRLALMALKSFSCVQTCSTFKNFILHFNHCLPVCTIIMGFVIGHTNIGLFLERVRNSEHVVKLDTSVITHLIKPYNQVTLSCILVISFIL